LKAHAPPTASSSASNSEPGPRFGCPQLFIHLPLCTSSALDYNHYSNFTDVLG
jgi:hypothetical protein